MARQSGAKKYFIARKGSKVYMPDPIHVSVRSITTQRQQDLFLGSDDCALIKGKRILLFAVGASPYDEKAFTEGVRRCLKGDLAGLPCFYGRGMWDLENMHFGDRTLCKMLLKATAKQDPSTFEPWQAALAAMKPGETADWTDKAYLEPLLAALC
jgi:hypothetical protein